jgi:hypothetical protein
VRCYEQQNHWYKYRTYMEPNKKFRKEAQIVKKKANSLRLLNRETGGSYFSTKMDASRQDCATPPCQFPRHGFYLLLQMSSNIKNKDSLSKQLSINLIEFTHVIKFHLLRFEYVIQGGISSRSHEKYGL